MDQKISNNEAYSTQVSEQIAGRAERGHASRGVRGNFDEFLVSLEISARSAKIESTSETLKDTDVNRP